MTQQDFRHSSSTLKASAKPMVDQASAVTSSRRAGVLSLVLLAVTILGLTAVIRAIPGTPDASAQSPVPSQRPATAQAPKRSQPAVTTSAASTGAAAVERKSTDFPKIVAVVNGAPISRDELAREALRRFGEKVLESEVNKHLILQECQRLGVQISREEIEAEITRVAQNLNLPPDRLYELIEGEGNLTPDQYRRDIIWPTLALRKLANDQLQVTSTELQEEFESEYGEKVQVRLILVGTRQKAERLLAQAQAAPDAFDKLAKDESDDVTSAAARGLVPPIRRHAGDPVIEKAAFALQPGQISNILEAAGQFVILKCERRFPPAEVSETERQVAMKILEDRIRERRLREVSTELFRKLQSNAKVVNVYNDPELRKKMPRVAATINGKQISIEELATQCLGRYGHEVLEGEINRMVLTQAMKRRSLQVSNADIDGEIRRAAVAYGYGKPDGSVEIDGWLERVQKESGSSVELYVRDVVWPTCALKKLVEAGVQLTEEDIQTGFEAHYGERVEVLAVVLSNQRTANEVYNMARSNPTDQFFGELAQQYSIEPMSKANFGQVPPISRHGGQPLLEQEAFKLKPGELSGILAIGDHFVVLRCLGRTKPVVDKLSDVRDELVADLRERKLRAAMDKEFASLKESAQVDNFVAGTLNVPRSSQVAPVNFEATDQQRSKAVRPIGTSSQRR